LVPAALGGGGAGTHASGTIRAFITEGQLASICDELSADYGVAVRLRDERGLVLSPDARAPGRVEPPPPGSVQVPLVVDDERIGSITVAPDAEGEISPKLHRIVRMLASLASELCEDVMELRHHVHELQVHYRLSDLLVGGGRVEETIRAALTSALELLELDAGSVVLLPEDADGLSAGDNEADLSVSASVGLSDAYVHDPIPLSRDRVFDRLALAGEVVAVEDLQRDGRVLLPERCVRERLASFINAGLVVRGQPLGVMRLYAREVRRFTSSDKRLIRLIGQQAAAAVEQARMLKVRSRERRTQRALKLAASVQQRMMPAELPRIAGLDLAARCVPSAELGGDLYDVFELPAANPGGAKRLGVVVGDVVGKGVPAALLMSAVRSSLRAYAEACGPDDPAGVMDRVNRALCRDSTPNEFATLWFGVFDPGARTLTSVNAGHDPPVIMRNNSSDSEELSRGGLVAGIDPAERYQAVRVPFGPGDRLVVYTDGMTDARSFDGQRFGRERLRGALEQAVIERAVDEGDGADARWILQRIFWTLRQFAGLAAQTDDETVVVVRGTGPVPA
jgi:serine phosphatase RsbU (regulator of sigma subunit)